MTRFASESFRLVLAAISRQGPSRWSLADVASAAGVSRLTAWRVLVNLRSLRLVRHVEGVRGWRRWETAPAWRKRTLEQVADDYEWAARSGMFSAAEKTVEHPYGGQRC